MISIFTGDDRVKAGREIIRLLCEDHETIEGADLTTNDLPNIFKGVSLFEDKRRILIRDLLANKQVADRLTDYLDTPHNIILQELKLDKRSALYKALKANKKVEIKEFNLPPDPNAKLVFDIYRTAKRDGKRAIAMLEQIKPNQDPIMFFGLLASQAIKDYSQNQGIKEKRTLKELSKLDLQMKSTSIDPWLLIEACLLRLS
jgi:DNA polymerase III delta subunit